LSNNHSEHPSLKQNQLKGEGSLPPRYTKHGKRNEEETDQEEMEREKNFPVIQVILYAFLALIAAFLIYWFLQQNQTAPSATTPTTESQEESSSDEKGGATSDVGDEQVNKSNETDSDMSDASKDNEEESAVGDADTEVVEESEDGVEQNPQTEPTNTEQSEESPDSQEPVEEPSIIAEHTVQSGETLYSITMKYYSSKKYMYHLAEYNGIKDTRNIEAGTKLIIPAKP
jgi:cytoskeletal protein RodZ